MIRSQPALRSVLFSLPVLAVLLAAGPFTTGHFEQVLKVPDAAGPQGPSCKKALGLLDEPPEPPPGPEHRYIPPKPDTSGMPVLVVDKERRSIEGMTGSNPDAVPVQPIEGTPEVLSRIGAAMRRAEAGKRLRLSFFGASHTGGDLWTGEIRRRLQDRWGDLGHGFILPAALYKGYRGQDINLCRTEGWLSDWAGKTNGHEDGLLGFGGMSVSSSNPKDFGWMETTRTNPHGRKVSWFDIFTLGQPGGGGLSAVVDGLQAGIIPTLAQSTRLQRTRIEVPDGAHRLVLAPQGDGEARIFGVSLERPGAGVLVDAMGIRGREARTWLSWNQGLFQQGLAALKPDVVVLAYGTNEAADQHYSMDAYRKDLRAVLSRLRAAVPEEVPCILAGPSDRGLKLGDNAFAIWDRTAPVAQIQREVAPEFGCASWDWQQATGGPGSMVAWYFHEPRMAAGDLIHFTRAGYQWSGTRFLAALDALAEGAPSPAPAVAPPEPAAGPTQSEGTRPESEPAGSSP